MGNLHRNALFAIVVSLLPVMTLYGCDQAIGWSLHYVNEIQESNTDRHVYYAGEVVPVYSQVNETICNASMSWNGDDLYIGEGLYFSAERIFYFHDREIRKKNSSFVRYFIQEAGAGINSGGAVVDIGGKTKASAANGLLAISQNSKIKLYRRGGYVVDDTVTSMLLMTVNGTLALALTPLRLLEGVIGRREEAANNTSQVDALWSDAKPIQTYALAAEFPEPEEGVQDLALNENGILAVRTAACITHLFIYKNREVKPWVSFVAFGEDDWVLWTPDKYFMQGKLTKPSHYPLFVLKDGSFVPFEAVSETFMRPDIVIGALKQPGAGSPQADSPSISDILNRPPPFVKFTSPDVKHIVSRERHARLSFLVKDTGGGIGEIRIYHNGKLSWSSIFTGNELHQTDVANEGVITQRTGNTRITNKTDGLVIDTVFQLVPGSNIFTIESFNGDNTYRSAQQSVAYEYDVPSQQGTTYIVAIGINKFRKLTDKDLHYAVKDAREIVHNMRTAISGMQVKSYLLVDESATRQRLIDVLEEVTMMAKPEDTLIFYAATHGATYASGRLHLLLYDSELSASSTLSAGTLMSYLVRIKALRQIVLLDVCFSGLFDNTTKGIFDARTRILSRGTGIHILGAAQSHQFAREGCSMNGCFTHAIKQALHGNADINNDGAIDMNELATYVNKAVVNISKGDQVPYYRSSGDLKYYWNVLRED